MKKLKWILPLLVLAVMLGGCPYQSEQTLDKPSIKVNNALIGRWESDTTSAETYLISKDDEFTYKIEKHGKEVKDVASYKAFVSKVDDDNFLNLWEDNGLEPISHYFYKLEMGKNNSKVSLIPVTENITEVFKTTEDLKAFFRKYKGLSFFYEKDVLVLTKH